MSKATFIYFLFILTLFQSCVHSKKSTDRVITKNVTKNPEKVKEAAEFAVSITLDQTKKEFTANDIQDAEMRSKINSLGSYVYVNYKDANEIPDSNVTFKTITLFGVTEIIYDFAANTRDFSNNTKNKRFYYFVKLADRVYYRRRQIPMM